MVTWSQDNILLFRARQHMKSMTFEYLNKANQTPITVFLYVMGKHGDRNGHNAWVRSTCRCMSAWKTEKVGVEMSTS